MEECREKAALGRQQSLSCVTGRVVHVRPVDIMCHWEVVHMLSMVLVLGAMDIMCHWEGGECDIHGKIGFKRGLFLPPAWWPATRRRRRRQLFSPVP